MAGVFVCCLALYYTNWRALSQADTIPAPYVAFSLASGRGLDLRAYDVLDKFVGLSVVELPDGRRHSKYPPGSALFALPVVLPFALLAEDPPRTSVMRRLGKLSGALASAGAAAMLYFVLARLAPAGALPASVLFAAGTSLWPVASQSAWGHGAATFWLCGALLLLLAPPARWQGSVRVLALGAGLCLGMAVLGRPTTILFAGASLAALAVSRQPAAALACALGAAFGAGVLVATNFATYGAPVAGGYGAEVREWTTPLHVGLAGLLASPSRGLLVYSPALLVIPFGLRAGARRLDGHARTLVALWGLACLGTLLLYSRWHVWWGGWCYGPRFLIETLPLLCLLFGLAWQSAGSGSAIRLRRVGGALIALSVAVQAMGVFGYDHNAWNRRHPLGPGFELRDTQIGAALRHLVGADARRP